MDGGGGEPPGGVVINPAPLGRLAADDGDGFDGGLNSDICALCGDGGLLLCCDGPCLRSFHPTREAYEHLHCPTLGFTTAQVEAMQHYFCVNCTDRRHLCAVCGVLGSSDEDNAQVFRCSHIACGRFYHAACIGNRLHPTDPVEAARCRHQIAAGMAFWCQGPHGRQANFYH